MERHELIVEATERNMRLEDFLFDRFPGLSRMYLREIVRDGRCEVNGIHENIGRRLRVGDFIEIHLDLTRQTAMRPENIPVDVVHEDAYLIVINKAPGMLVHPTHREKSGTLLNALAFHFNGERENLGRRVDEEKSSNGVSAPSLASSPSPPRIRPGLVHRLDKQTSGLMVVAKSVTVHRKLARQFQKKLVEKKYLALVEGIMRDDNGVIEGTIGRYPDEKRWDVKHDGKHSTSRYSVVARNADTTLLELEPVTGRTNQLRIHCASVGHPIVGDVSRGGRGFDRLCLHAWRLAFRHPISGVEHRFERNIDFCTAGGELSVRTHP